MMMKKSKILKKSSLFVCTMCAFVGAYVTGYQLAVHPWNDQISVHTRPHQSSRGLATNQGKRSIATVSFSEYSNSQNVFNKAKIIENSQSIHFVLGNIISKDQKGNPSFICQQFSSVSLFFEAKDLFVEGDPVTMTIKSLCKEHSDLSWIGPFNIPAGEILNSPISQTKFQFNQDQIEFNNVVFSWPQSWILKEVQFSNPNSTPFQVISDIPQTEDESFFSIPLQKK